MTTCLTTSGKGSCQFLQEARVKENMTFTTYSQQYTYNHKQLWNTTKKTTNCTIGGSHKHFLRDFKGSFKGDITCYSSISGYVMGETDEFMEIWELLGLYRYNAANHYHLSDNLLEEVLFWNPCAASWSSKRQNLSAEHMREWHWDSTGIGDMKRKKWVK